MKNFFLLALIIILSKNISFAQDVRFENSYPKIAGYTSIVHPIVAIDKSGSSFNFSNSYTVGFPIGINILKSDKIGFSFEMVPFLKFENEKDKVSNFLLHPGAMFRFKHGFTFITRLAFETNGRYGITLVFNKIIVKKKDVSYFISVPVAGRTGNDHPLSGSLALQFGIGF